MGLPEQQLQTWSHLGAQQRSQATYTSVKNALQSYDWPAEMGKPEVYLQGSYPNSTNIYGDSDVDIVAETSRVFYHNVPDDQRAQYGLSERQTGAYGWPKYKAEVLAALRRYYGHNVVTPDNKCIKIAGENKRLNADVVPCVRYRKYYTDRSFAKGVTFWTRADNVQVVNFPKIHLSNGSEKNSNCGQHYKPNIRLLKNARNRAQNNFPSYFLECLLYNVPNQKFTSSCSGTLFEVLKYLNDAKKDGSMSDWYCQNRQQKLFGRRKHQIAINDAHVLIADLIDLWNGKE